jgi:hypothetical protein
MKYFPEPLHMLFTRTQSSYDHVRKTEMKGGEEELRREGKLDGWPRVGPIAGAETAARQG